MNNKNEVFSNSVARQLGFDKYRLLIEKLHDVDISSDNVFQTAFKSYFRVRRGKEWCGIFFKRFEFLKDEPLNINNASEVFNKTLQYIYDKNASKGIKWKVEPSFVSKMLAVICNDLPIYDSEVVSKLRLPEVNGDLSIAKANYKKLIDRYKRFLKTDKAEEAAILFDEFFPDYKNVFSTAKKIDYFLWALTEDELDELGLFGEMMNE